MYRLETTHTFASATLEDERFETAEAAWEAAAYDYLASDHGESEDSRAIAARSLHDGDAPGTLVLSSGERIAVLED